MAMVHFVFHSEATSDPGDPDTFEEAWNGKDKLHWRPSHIKEIMNFTERGSWEMVPRKEAEDSGQSIVGTKVVYKTKDEPDGTTKYKTRIVSKGYAFVPGVDYDESYAPVAQDSSTRMCISIGLYYWKLGWTIVVIDVSGAFLEGPLAKPAYIEWPPGMLESGILTQEEVNSTVAKLVKGMYGNPDSALMFFREYKRVLKEMQMVQSKSDPCVFIKHDNEGNLVLMAVIHVDDTLLAGHPDWINWYKEGIGKRFDYTDQGKLSKHLGVTYEWYEDENGEPYIIARMPKMVKQIVDTYERFTKEDVTMYDAPAAPGTILEKSETEEPVEPEAYRCVVGKAMYLVTKIWASGSNPTRELTKYFSNPSDEHWKALEHLVGYLKKYEDEIYLRYNVPYELRPGTHGDSNYATNKEDRKSVSGLLFFLGGVLINWLSRTQAFVTLSSTEAELGAQVTAVQEVIFQLQLLQELGLGCKPAIMLIDNTGAIYLIKNHAVSQRTKHISVKWHFYREHHEARDFDPIHHGTDDNAADLLTKNLDVKTFQKHDSAIRNCNTYLRTSWFELVKKCRDPIYFHPKKNGAQG
jgi:hypothetical protein